MKRTALSTLVLLMPFYFTTAQVDTLRLATVNDSLKFLQQKNQSQDSLLTIQITERENQLAEQRAYSRSLEEKRQSELKLQAQLEEQSKEIKKLENDLKNRTKKRTNLQNKLDKQYANQAKLEGELQATKLQPRTSEQIKREEKLTKQLNKQIADREETERSLQAETNMEGLATQRLSSYQSSIATTPTANIVPVQTVSPVASSTSITPPVAVIASNATSNTQPNIETTSIPLEQSDIMKQVHRSLGNDEKGSVVVLGNLIVGNNNVILLVDDKTKADEIMAAIQRNKHPNGFAQMDKSTFSAAEPQSKSSIKSTYKNDSEDFYAPLKEKEYENNEVGKIKRVFSESLFDHASLGVKASTMGVGAELATTLSRNLQLRLGYDYIDYDRDINIDTKDEALKTAVGTEKFPVFKTTSDFTYKNAHALLDLYPMRNGIFHFTAGVYYGKSKINVDGQVVDADTKEPLSLAEGQTSWPNLHFADYEVPLKDGKAQVDMKLGKPWKPYFGIGLGRAVPKSRVGFKFELGVLYQGDFKIEQNGTELAIDKTKLDSFIDESDYTKWLKFYPMASLQIICRLW